MKIELKIDREGLQGIDDKTDADVVADWLAGALASAPPQAQAEPMTQILFDRALRRVRAAGKAGQKEVELDAVEFLMFKLTLVRANFKSEGMQMYVQMLKKFGVSLL